MSESWGFAFRNLYKVAKDGYQGNCTYCQKPLAGELRLIGWDICKQCDKDIVSGKLDANLPILDED